MEQKYSKELIDRTRQMYAKYSSQQLTDSDIVECIDKMSSLINYLATLQEKQSNKSNIKDVA